MMLPARRAKERAFNRKYKSRNSKNDEGPSECVICLDKVKERGKLSMCSHWFCFTCIYEWSKSTNTCPLCKTRFRCITKVHVDGLGSPPQPFRIKDKDQSIVTYHDDDYEVAMGLVDESDSEESEDEASVSVYEPPARFRSPWHRPMRQCAARCVQQRPSRKRYGLRNQREGSLPQHDDTEEANTSGTETDSPTQSHASSSTTAAYSGVHAHVTAKKKRKKRRRICFVPKSTSRGSQSSTTSTSRSRAGSLNERSSPERHDRDHSALAKQSAKHSGNIASSNWINMETKTKYVTRSATNARCQSLVGDPQSESSLQRASSNILDISSVDDSVLAKPKQKKRHRLVSFTSDESSLEENSPVDKKQMMVPCSSKDVVGALLHNLSMGSGSCNRFGLEPLRKASAASSRTFSVDDSFESVGSADEYDTALVNQRRSSRIARTKFKTSESCFPIPVNVISPVASVKERSTLDMCYESSRSCFLVSPCDVKKTPSDPKKRRTGSLLTYGRSCELISPLQYGALDTSAEISPYIVASTRPFSQSSSRSLPQPKVSCLSQDTVPSLSLRAAEHDLPTSGSDHVLLSPLSSVLLSSCSDNAPRPRNQCLKPIETADKISVCVTPPRRPKLSSFSMRGEKSSSAVIGKENSPVKLLDVIASTPQEKCNFVGVRRRRHRQPRHEFED